MEEEPGPWKTTVVVAAANRGLWAAPSLAFLLGDSAGGFPSGRMTRQRAQV